MKKKGGFIEIAAALIGIAVLGFAGIAYLNNRLAEFSRKSLSLGANPSFTPVQVQKTYLSGAGVGSTDTSVTLTSLKLIDGSTNVTMSNFGTIGYATIEPGVPKKEENISFTGISQNGNGTAVLTGVIRGLGFVYPYASSTSNAYQHSGGSAVVFSNSAPFYSQFAIANNTTTIAANWTFSSSSIPRFSSDTPTSSFTNAKQFIDKDYADSLTFSGSPNGSESQKGIWQGATQVQMQQGSSTGSTGANLLLQSQYANSTSSGTTTIPVTMTNGQLSPGFISTSSPYAWTGANSWSGTSTFTGIINASGTANISTTTVQGTLTLQSSTPSGVNEAVRKDYVDTRTLSTSTSTSRTPANSTATTTASLALPNAASSSYYDIGFYLGNGGSMQNSTTSIGINSTNLVTCGDDGSTGADYSLHITVHMLANTSIAQIIQPLAPNKTSCAFNTRLTAVDFSNSPTFNATTTMTTGVNVTTTISVFFQK